MEIWEINDLLSIDRPTDTPSLYDYQSNISHNGRSILYDIMIHRDDKPLENAVADELLTDLS